MVIAVYVWASIWQAFRLMDRAGKPTLSDGAVPILFEHIEASDEGEGCRFYMLSSQEGILLAVWHRSEGHKDIENLQQYRAKRFVKRSNLLRGQSGQYSV